MNVAADVSVYVRGGGTERYTGFDNGSQQYLPDAQSQAVLVRTSPTSYEKRYRDGSKEVFAQPNGSSTPRLVLLKRIVDPADNSIEIHYYNDGSNRIDKITDALGQETIFAYDNKDDSNKITKVTDPFSRAAVFDYADGKLASTTDPVGISSRFGYQANGNFINSLTTPYGAVTFTTGESGTNRWLNIREEETGAIERVEYRDRAPGIGNADPSQPVAVNGIDNSKLNIRNTFYWDKKALAMYPPVDGVYDYTRAKITHWLLTTDGSAVSGVISSEKKPSESRVWYTYPDQPGYSRVGVVARPSQVARVLDDGTTQVSRYAYNGAGNLKKATDPAKRVTSYAYASGGVDVLRVYQRNPAGENTDPDGKNADKIAEYEYNSKHLPVTSIDAARQITIRTYNSRGQVMTIQNPKGEITTYSYGDGSNVPDGYLASITSPPFPSVNGASAVTSFTYDSAHRVRTVRNNPDGYQTTTDYDDLDRPMQILYPDGTTRQFQYEQDFGRGIEPILDLTASKDRLGRWTLRHYNSIKQLDHIIDPLGRPTSYDWCACGSLTSITGRK